MGGYGSGRWQNHDKCTTVEECLSLSCGDLVSGKILRPNTRVSGTLSWHKNNQVASAVRFHLETSRNDGELNLSYRALGTSNKDFDCCIRLDGTAQHFGGYRFWTYCRWICGYG